MMSRSLLFPLSDFEKSACNRADVVDASAERIASSIDQKMAMSSRVGEGAGLRRKRSMSMAA
jgi:hypothetical protein